MFKSLLLGDREESKKYIGVKGIVVVKRVTIVDSMIVEELLTVIGTTRGIIGEIDPK